MAYVFPHGDLFVYTISILILMLLYIRVRVARRNSLKNESHDGLGSG